MAFNLVSTGSGVPLTLTGTPSNIVQVGVSNNGSKMAVISTNATDYTLTVYNVDYTNFNNPFSVYHAGQTVVPGLAGHELNADFEQVAVSNNGDHIFVVFQNNLNSPIDSVVAHFRWNGSGYDDINTGDRSFRMSPFSDPDRLDLSTFFPGTTPTEITGVVTNDVTNDTGLRIMVKKAPSSGDADEYIPIDVSPTTGALTFAKTSGDPHETITSDDLPGNHRAKFSKDLSLLAWGTSSELRIAQLNPDGTIGSDTFQTYSGTFQSILGVSNSKFVYMTSTGVYSRNISSGPILGSEVTLSTLVTALDTTDFTGAVAKDDASLIVVKEQLSNNARSIFKYTFGMYDETANVDIPLNFPLHVDNSSTRFISMNTGYAFDGTSGELKFYITEVITLAEVEVPEEPLTTGGWAGQGTYGNPNNRKFDTNYKNNIGLVPPGFVFTEPPLPAGLDLDASNSDSTYDNQIVKNFLYQNATDPGFAVIPYTVTGYRTISEESKFPHLGNVHALFLAPPTFDLDATPGTETFTVLPNTAEGYASVFSISIGSPYNANYSVINTAGGYVMTLNTPGSLVPGDLLVPFTATTTLSSTINALLKVTNTGTALPVEPVVEPSSLPLNVGGVVGTSTVTTLPINYNGNATVTYDFTSVPNLTSSAPSGTQPNYLTVTSSATVPGLYQTTFQLDGSTVPGSTNNPANFLFLANPGPIDLSAIPVTSTYTVLPGGVPAFPGLNSLTVTGLPSGVTFSSATGQFTVTKSSASSGFYPLTFTGTVGTETITVPMTLELQNTWTGPPAPSIPSSFVGGKYSGQSCVNNQGNDNTVTVTGKTESRTSLINDLVLLLSNIIRAKVDGNYMDPVVPVPDGLFHSETVGDYTTVLADTTAFFVGSYTGNQATAITNIVKTYFRQFRRFVLRFYNYVPNSESCGELQTPGLSTRVQDCYSSVTLTFSEM